MMQLTQNLRTGKTLLQELPAPMAKPGYIIIQTHKSLISPGTEKMLISFAKAGFIQKAKLQPEKVRLAYDKIRSDGFFSTITKIYNKLDEPIPLGYCNVGHVLSIGEGIHDISVGDRVVSNGSHAEIVSIPRNLVARVPANVPDEAAVFTVIASIALNAVRLVKPSIGETVVVFGLGLIGMLTADLLRISGCQVIGIEPDSERRAMATSRSFLTVDPSRINPQKYIDEIANGAGADAVIIATASGSSEVINQAADICRKKGRIVLVGTTELTLNRSIFYHKELTFQVASSYGPGRYDVDYEEKGLDYPLPYVRWTENRNFQAILQLLSTAAFDPTYLISKTFPLTDFKAAYEQLSDPKCVAVVFDYPQKLSISRSIQITNHSFAAKKGVIGIIGAGNYVVNTMLPLLKNESIKYIASASGMSAAHLAKKYNIANATTDYQEILADPEVDLVIIATRHNLHASMTIAALQFGKHIFTEKPLALTKKELTDIIKTYNNPESPPLTVDFNQRHDNNTQPAPTLTVGFNRRQSSHAQKMKNLLAGAKMNIVYTINAGSMPTSSWVHDPEVGGGRIIGEACHFIDLIVFLTRSKIASVCMNAMQLNSAQATDNASILLKCSNGSTGVVNYFSNGHSDYQKERIEVYSTGRTLILDNFERLEGFGFKGFTQFKCRQDKGHANFFALLMDRVKTGGPPIIPLDEIINTAKATLAALESWKLKAWVDL